MSEKEEIAIVGVGCKFPGADNVTEYWRVLKNGENHVKEVPRNRWNIDAFYDPDRNAPGKTYVRTAGFVKSIDEWDHRFFGINDMEAELVDPQQRIVLDCVHMALEDGGITRSDIEGTNTGVYIGSMTDDFKGHVMSDTTISSTYSVTGTHNSIISARVSYTYNLSGPAMTLDTACSSSLVAIDVASQALLTGKCNMAICGGVNILMDPQLFIALSKAGMLSPSGQCKTFTRDADGYARGEGCGIVLLKSLKNAVADGNKVWGTIKTGTNQDGHMATPITAPSGLQQEQLIKEIYERNKVDKARIGVIEAHGTGTAIGDPTEANALGSHFGMKANAPDKVIIGSVKTNIGHLEAAAGVAGLIKVLLMIKHDMIVPSLWYTKENENPKVKLSEHGFVVPMQCIPWKRSGKEKRIACVNSFGFGGTNAHAIVEEYELPTTITQGQPNIDSPLPFIIAISAFDESSLIENVQHIYDILKSQLYDMRALSYTSTCKRDHRHKRLAVYGHSQDDILAACTEFLSLNEAVIPQLETKKIIFVFCGVGTAWNGMCTSLLKLDPFKQALAEVDKYLRPLAGWTISSKLTDSSDILANPMIAHIAIFACQVGLAALWKHFYIRPDIVIGQSVGEVAAAYVAGNIDLQTAVKIIFYRSKFLAAVKSGRMAVIRNVEIGVVEQCCKSNGAVSIAVYNSPKSCTVSGNEEDVQRLKTRLLATENLTPEVIDLDVKCAYHSQHVEQAAKQLATELENIVSFKGQIPVISTVTGQIEKHDLFGTSSYWEQNVRMPVHFSSAVKSLESNTNQNIFLEIGPSPVLRAHIEFILTENKSYSIFPSVRKGNEMSTLAGALCKLYGLGFDLNWKQMFLYPTQRTDIPMYQFRKYGQLHQSPTAVKINQGVNSSSVEHMFIMQLPQKDGHAYFKMVIDEKTTAFVYQHVVKGSIILPGAIYADIGFEIGATVLGLSKKYTTVSLDFLRPVRIEKGVKTILHITTAEQKDELLFLVKYNQVTMCKGSVRTTTDEEVYTSAVDIECLKLSLSNLGYKRMFMSELYDQLESIGFKYGPYFKLMRDCITNGTESLTTIDVPENILRESGATTIHPCVLDVMMQSTISTTTEVILTKMKKEKLSFLPVALGDLRVLKKADKQMFIFTRRINTTMLETVLQVHYNILLINLNGEVVADLRNYTTYGKRNDSLAPCELKYRLTWHPFDKVLRSKEGDPNTDVLVLTNQYIEDVVTGVEGLGNIVVFQNKRNVTIENYIANAFERRFQSNENKQAFDSVLLLVGEYKPVREIATAVASDIHECLRNNCMLLAELVKYMTNNKITSPLYIATQNTQPAFSNFDSPTINLVGGELWGFVRSILLELIHGAITLIDLQPSFFETKRTLFQFIYDTCHNLEQTKPEIVIRGNKIFGSQFTKVPRKEIIPSLRAEKRIAAMPNTPQKVLALRSKQIKSLVLTAARDKQEKHLKENMKILIKTVCIHPLSIYPRTTSGINLDQDIWKEAINDGHSLFGLEYTGLPLSRTASGKISCRRPEIQPQDEDLNNKWEIVCIYPKEIATEMIVPKSCTVSLKDIPFYRPGLLLYTVLCWRLVEYVPNRSSVVILSQHPTSKAHMTLECLLKDKRSAYIVDPSKENEDTGKRIDILISLGKLDSSFVLLGRCTKIICLEESISESVRIKVSRSAKQTVDCLSAAHLLDKRHVSNCLQKVVSWLQRYYKSDSENFADDTECDFTCRSVDIMKNGRTAIPVQNTIDKLFSKDAVYIVTGGLTGLGWEIVRLLAEMGAGVVATMSRRNVPLDKEEDISNTEKTTGCKIVCIRGDVTDLNSVQAVMKEIEIQFKFPIRGVFHGAGTLMGTLLMNLEASQLDFVLRPKIIGTLNMHIATTNMDLDYFVVASSISSLIGSPGQSSYGAANSFLDTFIEWRRKRGLAGQSINWGALCVGMASRPEFVENFSKRGFNLLSVLEIRSCFQEALMTNSTNIVYTVVNWDISAKNYTYTKLERTRLQMSLLIEQAVSYEISFDKDRIDSMSFDIQALQKAGTERQKSAITQIIQNVSSKVIGGEISQIKTSSTLVDLLFDSMSTITFINVIHDITGHRIAPSFMLEPSHTLDDIVHFLHDAIFNVRASSSSGEHQPPNVDGKHNALHAVETVKDSVVTPVENL